MPTDTHADALRKVAELIKEIRTAMLMTLDETGTPRSRPMYTHEVEFDGDLWFMTGADSAKVREIAHDPASTWPTPRDQAKAMAR